MAGFVLSVEDELGVMTQVATPGGLKLLIRDRVPQEAITLCGVTMSGGPSGKRIVVT